MTKRHFAFGFVLAVYLLRVSLLAQTPSARDAHSRVTATEFANLPLSFEANRGQTDPRVKFLSRGRGYTLFLTGSEAVLKLAGRMRPSDVASVDASTPSWQLGVPPEVHRVVNPASNSQRSSSANTSAEVVRLRLLGTNASAKASGADELLGKSNYFIGSNPKNWRTNVENFAKVKYEGVYPGIDLAYYGNEGQLENDFVLAPGAEPSAIQISLSGIGSQHPIHAQITGNGDLSIRSGQSEVTLRKPVSYQLDSKGERHSVDSRYVLRQPGSRDQEPIVSFDVSGYDHSRSLIIDPTLAYSSYLGGTGVDGRSFSEGDPAIAVDSSGNVYIDSSTTSIDFPIVSGAYQPSLKGGPSPCNLFTAPSGDCGDAVVTKVSADGSKILASTYLGGSDADGAVGIAVDGTGVYVLGFTKSYDFPTTAGAFQTALNEGKGTSCSGHVPEGPGAVLTCSDAFVTKLDTNLSNLIYSTLLGGSEDEFPNAIAVDGSQHAYATGFTFSTDYPTSNGAFQTSFSCPGGAICQDVFVAALNPSGTGVVYSTFLGNGGAQTQGIAVDSSGNVYLTGVINQVSGTPVTFPTTPTAYQFVMNVPATGFCQSAPWLPPPQYSPVYLDHCWDGFLTKIDPSGSTLLYSTIFGGTEQDFPEAVAVDQNGYIYITGYSKSPDFPVTAGAYDTIFPAAQCNIYDFGGPNCMDAFVAKFDPTKSGSQSLLYSTFLGGSGLSGGNGIAVDSAGNAYITGVTDAFDFPTVTPIQSQFADGIDCRSTTGFIGTPCGDAFVAELNPSGSNLIFSTYLGGSKLDYPGSLARDLVGNIYVAGFTSSSDFPTTPGVFQTTYQGNSDLFIAKISPSPNTSSGAGVSIQPTTNVSLTFNSVSTSGTTAVTQTPVAPPAPSGFTVGTPATYYELSTTATYSGNITVCFNYSGVTFPSGTPQLLHYQNGSWVNVTTSVDETNLIICGAVTSLSPFGVFGAPVTVVGLSAPLTSLVPVGSPVPLPSHAFKQGSTLPLKLQLYAGSTLLTDATTTPPQITALVKNGNALNLDTIDPDTGQANDNGTLLRYSGPDWVFNLGSQGLRTGTYTLTIKMPGGLSYNAGFVLK